MIRGSDRYSTYWINKPFPIEGAWRLREISPSYGKGRRVFSLPKLATGRISLLRIR